MIVGCIEYRSTGTAYPCAECNDTTHPLRESDGDECHAIPVSPATEYKAHCSEYTVSNSGVISCIECENGYVWKGGITNECVPLRRVIPRC